MGALSGLKVLDFSTLLPGPYATMVLADLGAEVLRVTSKSKPDLVTQMPPLIPGTDVTASAAWLGRGKRSMFLNLKHPAAKEVVNRLILDYDIVMEQFRPGVMDKLGFGYEAMKKVNPRIIYCSLTGYGQSGAMKDKAGHDINYISRSGVMSHSGRKSEGPVLTDVQIADLGVGSMNSVVGILAAVIHRNATGEGQHVDVAMLDGMLPFNAMHAAGFLVNQKMPQREGELLNGGSLYDFYKTKDGRYISVGALEPKFFEAFCVGLELPELIAGTAQPVDIAEAKEKVRGRVAEKTLAQWMEIFDATDACVEPVMNLEEALLRDGHIGEREMVVDVPLPLNQGETVKQVGNPIKLSSCPSRYRHSAYPEGYHTGQVMESLGYSASSCDMLERDGLFD